MPTNNTSAPTRKRLIQRPYLIWKAASTQTGRQGSVHPCRWEPASSCRDVEQKCSTTRAVCGRFRKDKGKSSASGGRWIGPARVLGTEGRSLVWLIHGGVPITASIESLRRATGKEALAKRERELRPSRKRRRDVLEDDGVQDYPFGDDLVGSPTAIGGLGEPQQVRFSQAEETDLD